MLLTKCVYGGDEKVGGTVNNTGGAKKYSDSTQWQN